MLVLTRKRNQAIEISTSDGPIKLTVVSVGEANVKIGIDAPPSCLIERDDVKSRVNRHHHLQVL